MQKVHLTLILVLLTMIEARAQVVVNGEMLSNEELVTLHMAIGATPPPGRYWYDALLGAWGHEGQGTAGFVGPHLPIRAPLPPNISGGLQRHVTVNGRFLHPSEIEWLAQCTTVETGRYWLRWDGIGGIEGSPHPAFNLLQMCGPNRTKGASSLLSFGGVVSDGKGFGFTDSEGRGASGGW